MKPAATAVLVIDMTNDFLLEGAPAEVPAGRAMIPRLARLIAACREAGAMVVYTSHMHRADGSDLGRMADVWADSGFVDSEGKPTGLIEGSDGVRVHDDLAPVEGDHLVVKRRSSAFFECELDTILRQRGIGSVIVTGVATNGCCYATALDAGFRGYEVFFAADATATTDLPDTGFGAFSAAECQRVTLSTVALAVGEVKTTGELIEQIGGSSVSAAGAL